MRGPIGCEAKYDSGARTAATSKLPLASSTGCRYSRFKLISGQPQCTKIPQHKTLVCTKKL